MTERMMLAMHVAACFALFYNCFCRLVKTNDDTVPSVRAGFMLVATSSAVLLASPWLWGLQTSWFVIGHVGSMSVLQSITSRYWRSGVPCQYQRPTKEQA